MDIRFFNDTWDLYSENYSTEKWCEFFNLLFIEISKIPPENLIQDHLIWMDRCEKYYAHIENYERANILKQVQQAARNVFRSREELEQIKNNFYNK